MYPSNPPVTSCIEPEEPPAVAAGCPRIDVCFVLDTTGSMGGPIEGAKQRIWSIANEIVAARPFPMVRFSLVAYRNRGDRVVARVTPLTEDLDAIHVDLRGFRSAGGKNLPEAEERALRGAVSQIGWDDERDVSKVIYLIGAASQHAKRSGEWELGIPGEMGVGRKVRIASVP